MSRRRGRRHRAGTTFADLPPEFLTALLDEITVSRSAKGGGPALLIADEPTTALDSTVQAQILELIAELSREMHTATILITHNLGIVAGICDRVAVIDSGRIVAIDTPAALAAHLRDALAREPQDAGEVREVTEPVLAELDRLESLLASAGPGEADRVTARLDAVVARWHELRQESGESGVAHRLADAGDDEVFEFLGKEFGIQ